MRLGFIGVGVVGGAAMTVLSRKNWCVAYDKHRAQYQRGLGAVLGTEVVFVSVPTPTNWTTGEQDQSALLESIRALEKGNYTGIVVVKSTVLPGTCARLARETGLKIVHSPEFLTAASPVADFESQGRVVLGGPADLTERIHRGVFLPFGWDADRYEDATVTETIKYIRNLFLATKVGFCNEMSEFCAAVGVDYATAMDGAVRLGGIGEGHTRVPGPDGLPGFGGMCFPKDALALLAFAHKHGIGMPQLAVTLAANDVRRPRPQSTLSEAS